VFEEICNLLDAHPDRPATCLGLAFKANIDDLRESPAVEIAERLAHRYGERISVVEPFVDALPEALTAHGARHIGLEEALAQRGILVLLVDHDMFRKVSDSQRAGAVVYDTRGVWGQSPAPAARQRQASAA
jgi:UDP-N-acetyl-D-mannosaminuronic acid dehydrogenase